MQSIHLVYCSRYGIRQHAVESVVENAHVCIRADVSMSHNRPDIVVHSKEENAITIVEVSVTSLDHLRPRTNVHKHTVGRNQPGRSCYNKKAPASDGG